MKIFYAIQATGNGHISRAIELIPHLEQYGTVDLFLSGSNAHLDLPVPVKYRSRGCSLFYDRKGGLDYWKIFKGLNLSRVWKETRDLPVDQYDLIINDYESLTALACLRKGVPSIQFGHQASFQSPNVPRPDKPDWFGECILRNYAKASGYVGLHFLCYDEFIFPPVIKQKILYASPTDEGHICVYLPSVGLQLLKRVLGKIAGYRFEIFSSEVTEPVRHHNLAIFPIDHALFNDRFIKCNGIITGAGFETPAEAMHMGKRLMVIPCGGQYEQQCNGAALNKIGVTVLPRMDENFESQFEKWIVTRPIQLIYKNDIELPLEYLFFLQEQVGRKQAIRPSLYPSG